jgi:hypothetical protein
VSSFLAASKIAAAAFVRIWRFIHPCEFGADLSGARHFLVFFVEHPLAPTTEQAFGWLQLAVVPVSPVRTNPNHTNNERQDETQ